MIDLQTIVKLSNNVVARKIGGETVILQLESGNYFSLDGVGGSIWEILEANQRVSLQEIFDALIEKYEVEEKKLEEDVVRLAQTLAENELITLDA